MDTITYDTWGGGLDIGYIDGGSGEDNLTVYAGDINFTMLDREGRSIYTHGDGGLTTITVADIEHITVIKTYPDGSWEVAFRWSKP